MNVACVNACECACESGWVCVCVRARGCVCVCACVDVQSLLRQKKHSWRKMNEILEVDWERKNFPNFFFFMMVSHQRFLFPKIGQKSIASKLFFLFHDHTYDAHYLHIKLFLAYVCCRSKHQDFLRKLIMLHLFERTHNWVARKIKNLRTWQDSNPLLHKLLI